MERERDNLNKMENNNIDRKEVKKRKKERIAVICLAGVLSVAGFKIGKDITRIKKQISAEKLSEITYRELSDDQIDSSNVRTYEVERKDDAYIVRLYSVVDAYLNTSSDGRSYYTVPVGYSIVDEKYGSKLEGEYRVNIDNGEYNVYGIRHETFTYPAVKNTSVITYTDENGKEVSVEQETYRCTHGGVLTKDNYELVLEHYYFNIDDENIKERVISAVNKYNKENNTLTRK